MNGDALTLTTSVAGATAILASYSLMAEWLFRRRRRLDQRFRDEFELYDRASDENQSIFRKLTNADLQDPHSLVARFHQLVEQSGLQISPGRVVEIGGAAALVAALVTAAVTKHWALCLPAAALAFTLPLLFLDWKRRQRMQKLSNQLPEAFELMSRAVRAGQTMPAAFRLVANEAKPPIATEFSQCCEQQDLGLPQEVTLRELARRNGVMELQMFSVALLVQRQTGGSPVELLNNLSKMVRKRIRMKAKVRALTGEGRLQAVVLSILPLVAFAAIYLLKRDYAEVLLETPLVLVGTAISTVIGSLWIRKIVNFEY